MLFVVLLGAVAVWRSDARQPGEERREAPPAAKREQPDVLPPVEGKAAVVFAQLKSYVFDTDNPRGKLHIKVKINPPAEKGPMGRDPWRDERQALARQFAGERAKQAADALKGNVLRDNVTREYVDLDPRIETKFVPVDALGGMQDVRLLQTIRPVRMAEIAAAFPFRSQVEEFRKKLRLPSARAVLEEASTEAAERQQLEAFRFLGVVVERRQVDRQGKPLFPDAGQNGYVPLDIGEAFKPLLVLSGLQTEDEDRDLEPVLQDGLVMPRPFSARKDQYPPIENELPAIRKTLEELNKARKGVPPRDPLVRPRDDKITLAEHCLIRVLDVTVQPGESYQYRLRIRMANPNYGCKDVADPKLAKEKELPASQWFEVPGVVVMPPELHIYAVDQKEIERDYRGAYARALVGRDQTVLQIHKYVENASPDRAKNVPVGEWSVAERVVVSRGEVIDRPVRVEMPVLVEEEGKWQLASTRAKGDVRDPGIDVWFDGVRGRPMVLVDFDGGGTQRYRRGDGVGVTDRAGQEVLILGPDGKLLAHYAGVDAADRERQEMLKKWRERIDALKKDRADDPKQPMNPFDKGRP